MIKLYDFAQAPNPRRVKIFAEEKQIALELVNCHITSREHKSPEFLKKKPSGKIPVLELEDGRCISESMPICRYLESLEPEPNLFGEDAFETAFIESRNRYIELELWTQIGTSRVNGSIFGAMGLFKQIPAAKEASDNNVNSYYKRLDNELSSSGYVAGNRYRVADITLLSAIDFASSMVELKPDESLKNLNRWHNQIQSPSSAI